MIAEKPLAYISIHSLVKRETPGKQGKTGAKGISIHSLVKRETECHRSVSLHQGHFNPLPRKEGD